MTPKLTLNLGVRWDYFGPINETNGGQANFVPIALPAQGLGNPTFIVPASGKDNRTLSTKFHLFRESGATGLVDLLAADGITLDVNQPVRPRTAADAKGQLRSPPWHGLPDHPEAGRRAAALACSSTRLKTRDTDRTSARTIPSCSTSDTSVHAEPCRSRMRQSFRRLRRSVTTLRLPAAPPPARAAPHRSSPASPASRSIRLWSTPWASACRVCSSTTRPRAPTAQTLPSNIRSLPSLAANGVAMCTRTTPICRVASATRT